MNNPGAAARGQLLNSLIGRSAAAAVLLFCIAGTFFIPRSCEADFLHLREISAHGSERMCPDPVFRHTGTVLGTGVLPQESAVIPECLPELFVIIRSIWDLGVGLVLGDPDNTQCYALTTAEDVLFIFESMIAYRICVMEYDGADEEVLQQWEIFRKSVLVVDEFMYIIELLYCHDS